MGDIIGYDTFVKKRETGMRTVSGTYQKEIEMWISKLVEQEQKLAILRSKKFVLFRKLRIRIVLNDIANNKDTIALYTRLYCQHHKYKKSSKL